MIVEIVIFILTLYIASLFFKANNEKNLPPGPWRFPYIGNLPVTKIEQGHALWKKYGNIFSTKLGALDIVYIANFGMAKEALSKMEFADRPHWEMFHLLEEERKTGAPSGVILSNGELWQRNRRFLLRHLRDLGMGTAKIEDIILREVENLVEDFNGLTKEPSELPFSINVSIVNVIWQLVSSERFDFSDNSVKDFMSTINEVNESFLVLALKDFFPILRYLPTRLYNHLVKLDRVDKAVEKFRQIIQPCIDDHIKRLDPNNPKDLMDDYLALMLHEKSEENSHFCCSDLIKNTFDLFIAGNDTTGNMTRWVIIYMAKFQDIQKKIQAQIDDVVPFDRIPSLEHRERLAILDATINEVQRHASLLPFGVFRAAAKDTIFHGFHIRKGTVLNSLAGITHKDPTYWKDPEIFDPTRFLDENNKFVSHMEGFQPFGLGKRQCLGEPFARMELYLILAALLQKFAFGPPDGYDVDIEPVVLAQVHEPNKKQKFCIKLRENME